MPDSTGTSYGDAGGSTSSSFGIVGPILSLIGQASSGHQTRKFSRQMQERQAQMQLDMSSTAYQRAVADMRAAGLNPAMMFGGSGGAASTPSVTGSAPAMPDLTSLGSTAKQSLLLESELDLLREQRKKVETESFNVAADTQKKQSEVELNNWIGDQIRADTQLKKVNSALAEAQLPEAKATAEFWSGEQSDTVKAIEKILSILGLGRRAVAK